VEGTFWKRCRDAKEKKFFEWKLEG
jgi:hypothetical protein